MPAPANVPEFLELVRKSGLVPESKLDESLGRHRVTGTPQTVDQAAAQLVRDAQLTYFQAKQIKFGRYKRFTIGSKYRLLELIGAGGMGAVYLCEHTFMKRLVALKVLPTEKLDDQSNLERFYREARAVAALDHPNIVRAYDIDQYEKLHFLVMEYVDGHSLQEIVARYALEKRLFDPLRAAHYIAQAAVGMQHAHELGMVHRDIKPGNLLLDRSGVIKVLDMGLARFFNKQQDSVTEKYDDKCVLGTADYLAPEQAVTNVVDVRADIYSLGGTLYFMLTGQTPFPDGTIAAKLVAHQTREPREVEAFRSDVPPGILDVLRKMMAKRPEDRFQQPIEVAEALAEWTEQATEIPPEREMPNLCPLVQSLLGPSSDRSSAQSSIARALFAPGRGVFARANGSSVSASNPPSGSTVDSQISTSHVEFPALSKATQQRYTSESKVPGGGPVSTARASASPTAPLPASTPAVAGSGLTKGKVKPGSAANAKRMASAAVPPIARRTWLAVALGVGITAFFLTAIIVAYQLGKGNGTRAVPPTNPESANQANETPHFDDLEPSPRDRIFTPERAMERVGEVQTVEIKVQSVSGQGPFTLHSKINSNASDNFAVRGDATVFKVNGNEDLQQNYLGKTIRVRGKIMRGPELGLYIDVRLPKQIVIVDR